MEGPGLRIMTEKYSSVWTMLMLRGGSCVVPGDMWHPDIPRPWCDHNHAVPGLDENGHRLPSSTEISTISTRVERHKSSGPRPLVLKANACPLARSHRSVSNRVLKPLAAATFLTLITTVVSTVLALPIDYIRDRQTCSIGEYLQVYLWNRSASRLGDRDHS
jgi:hypothetical protein